MVDKISEKNSALEYIYHTTWLNSRPGLTRVRELLARMGNPQDGLQYIHVAGTNGKGSVSAMLASVLRSAGYKTGLFTSPYVRQFNERMQVDGRCIDDEELLELTRALSVHADAMDDHPTEFEIVTALGFAFFARQQCDVVVLEVGMGGRLDATNIIQTPLLAVITAMGLDHTEQLGGSIEAIAAEKAGIIKEGGTVVLYPQVPAVQAVFAAAVRQQGGTLVQTDESRLRVIGTGLSGQRIQFGDWPEICIPLLGSYQPCNAALAITAVEALRQKGWKVPEAAVKEGLEAVRWPARFQLVRQNPAVVVDGGHNPQGADLLAQSLEQYFPGRKCIFVMGVMAGKDYTAMAARMAPLAKQVVCVAPDVPRALPAQALADAFDGLQVGPVSAAATVLQGVEEALRAATAEDVVCIFGSLYMAGEVLEYFEQQQSET